MLFVFDKLLQKCLPHDGIVTNRLREDRLRTFFSFLIEILANHSSQSFQEIKKKDRHFHLLVDKEKMILEKVLKKYYPFKQLRNYFNNLEICQMSLDNEEGRMIGIIQQINTSQNHPERNHLFSPLFFDFEHSFHPNLKKKRLKEPDLICVMKEKDC